MLEDYLHIPLKQVFYARETHSGNVLVVDDEHSGSLAMTEEAGILGPAGGQDALVTATPGILLCIWTADCLPLFLYDTEGHVAAIAHCGWRSICNGIVSGTVDVMVGRFHANPGDIVAAFGPGICANCYEVRSDLIEAFSKRFPADEIGEFFVAACNGEYHLDLRKAVAFELARMGVRLENLFDAGICSYETEGYSSYRRDGDSEPSKQTLSGIVLAS